ncbi:hypothetical protein C4D60_Mb00t18770 [Musa balbisiana]|uniref:ATPase F1/V1/A1 complex alpha/beta subunit N-terminal domain-containing protein n=1 Tax=Musa balbisiana TaxID=52838 RepID=A0A4S8I4G9_MUSBA|nr:hypothetical protein C4D60_Mb00t18770 [Musa balbisiana]
MGEYRYRTSIGAECSWLRSFKRDNRHAMNLESNNVGVVLMGDGLMIQEGSSVKATGRIATETCE